MTCARTEEREQVKIGTIGDAKRRYRESAGDAAGYRDLISLLIDSGFRQTLRNDSYFDALVLTEVMYNRTKQSIRSLTGKGGEGFICELMNPFTRALERIHARGGTVKLIVLGDEQPQALCELAKRFSGTLRIAVAKPLSRLQHFIICDSRIVRLEDYHGELSDSTSAHEIKAEVFFNNSEKARMLESFFEAIWSSVSPLTS